MAYIGNTVNNQGFTPAIDYFSGNGSTVTFTLSRPVVSVAQMIVAIDNVIQNPSSAFTVSGNSITFTSAPLAGTNNIWVEYTSLITQYNAISQDPSVIGDITATGGFLAVGDFGNTYTDGTIVDYVTGNARITTGPADGLTIYNGGTASRTALMAIDSSGNVGIGTTSPAEKLTVNGASRGAILATGGTVFNYFTADSSNSAGFIGTGSAHPLAFITSATERMRIDSSGNVGIGTTTPANKFAVSNAGAMGLEIVPTGGVTSAPAFYSYNRSGAAWAPLTYYANYHVFGVNGTTEAMRIDTSGNLLVGTTTTSANDGGIAIFNNSGNRSRINLSNNSGATQNIIAFYYGATPTNVGNISVSSTATAYGTSSDYRLKENIAPMQNALNVVQQLKPVTYNWKVDGSSGQGFIAHELQAVVPDCVTGEKDAVDADGNPIYQGIDTSFLVATLTAAIKEQQAIIEDLKARIETLGAK